MFSLNTLKKRSLLILFIIPVFGYNQMSEGDYLNQARGFFQSFPEKSIELLSKGIENYPNSADLYRLRAFIKQVRSIEDPKEDYDKAYSLDSIPYQRSGYPSPYLYLTNEDELKYPIDVELEFILKEIYDFDTRNTQFFTKFDWAAYSKYDTIYQTNSGKTTDLVDLRKLLKLDYIASDQTKITDLEFYFWQRKNKDQLFFEPGYMGKFSQYYGSVENSFYHNWDLRDYPFDKQKIVIRFVAQQDSSIVRLTQSKEFPASFSKNMIGLKDGYNIDKINYFNTYVSSGIYDFFSPTSKMRYQIFPTGNFEIVISRDGSWLFMKLFLGSILSFVISWIVFLIPNKEFESRISLTVGGIFGAIGNRYFVESTIPNVQILTKADMINNMILFLLIVNVFIVIIQNNDKISMGAFEKNNFAMIFSGLTFLVSNLLIVLW
ncbi:MAG: hypothetical protein VX325_00990 [Bacteroidota bacterium]|nr:hypothetical protein [Bacteroidota bacterium]